MNNHISPKYLMKLVKDIETAIWEDFKSYKEAKIYISKWHVFSYDINGYSENFEIITKSHSEDIDLVATLHSINSIDIIKIAIDLGVHTPDFIPSIPTFKNDIKAEYKNAYATFEKAYKQIETEPGLAIGLANSSLESIIKEILKDDRFETKIANETLFKLSQIILKEFNFNNKNFPVEIKTICSSLMAICQSIEKLRSDKTDFHGKTDTDFVIDDAIFATLTINSTATVGLFLNSYYKNKHPKKVIENTLNELDDLPF
jgi:hypothetical protein